jgi:DNA-binding MurR/RpiR family transcriptional regulator
MKQTSKNYQTLKEQITAEHNNLSKRLKQVASFVIDHPTDVALETIVVIAKRIGVQPSTLIRFAKAFNYSGFKEMQQIFQNNLSMQSSNYKERVQNIITADNNETLQQADYLLQKFCHAGIASLENLQNDLADNSLEKATTLLLEADNIYIAGQRRAYPIATYLTYGLNHCDCRAHLLDGAGGLIKEQSQTMRKNDVLIATTFYPYSESTLEIVRSAVKKGLGVITITDTRLSPVAELATVSFNTVDPELHGFRSLTASLCLTQVMVALVALKQKNITPSSIS